LQEIIWIKILLTLQKNISPFGCLDDGYVAPRVGVALFGVGGFRFLSFEPPPIVKRLDAH
jgi:hypothetical protein